MADSPPTPPDPSAAPRAPAQPKPGRKTSEFYLKWAAIILSALFAAGVIPTDGPIEKIAMIAASVLLSLGYTVSRTIIKTSAQTQPTP